MKSIRKCVGLNDNSGSINPNFTGIKPTLDNTIQKQKTIKKNYNLNCVNTLLGGFLENISQSPVQYLFYHFYTYFSYLYISYLVRYNKGITDLENDLSEILLSSLTIEEKKYKLQNNPKVKKLGDIKERIIKVACMQDGDIQENLKQILSYLDFMTYTAIRNYFCNDYFRNSICNHFQIPKLDKTNGKNLTYLVLSYLIIFTFKNKDEEFNLGDTCVDFRTDAGNATLKPKIDELFTEYKFDAASIECGALVDLDLQKYRIIEQISAIFYYKFPPAKIEGETNFIGTGTGAGNFTVMNPNQYNIPAANNVAGQIFDFSANRPRYRDSRNREFFYFASLDAGHLDLWYLSLGRNYATVTDRLRMYFKFCTTESGYYYQVLDCIPTPAAHGVAAADCGDPGNGYTQYTLAYNRNDHEWGWYTAVGNDGTPTGDRLSVEIENVIYYYKYYNSWGWYSLDNTRLDENGNFMYRQDPDNTPRNIKLEPSGVNNLILQPRYITIPKQFRSLLIFATIIEFLKNKKEINSTVDPGRVRSFRYNRFFQTNGHVNIRDNNEIRDNFPLIDIYTKIVNNCINDPIPQDYDDITKNILKFIRENNNIIHNYSLPRR